MNTEVGAERAKSGRDGKTKEDIIKANTEGKNSLSHCLWRNQEARQIISVSSLGNMIRQSQVGTPGGVVSGAVGSYVLTFLTPPGTVRT